MLKWYVVVILCLILLFLIYIISDRYKTINKINEYINDNFEDITEAIQTTTTTTTTEPTDIKTWLYTALPESIDDFDKIKDNIGYYRLSNGLEVILINCPDSGNNITVEAVVKSGFITDPVGYDELNHLIEHLVFMKTKHFNSLLDIQKFIPLADYNGETGQLDVGLHWTMTATTEDKARDLIYLSRMMFVLKEMIYNAEFNHDKFETEKNIVVREYDIRASNIDFNHDDNMGKEVYKNSDFKKIYGTNPENIAKITPEIATEYYRKFYKPDNIRVFVYGKLPNWPIETSDEEIDEVSTDDSTTKPTTTKPIPLPKQEESARLKQFYGNLLKTYFVDNPDDVIKMDDLYTNLMSDPYDIPSTTLASNDQFQKLGYEYTFDLATIQNWLNESQTRLLTKQSSPTIEYISNGPTEKRIDDIRLTQSKTYAIFRHPRFLNQRTSEIEWIITSILYDKLFKVLREDNGLVYGVDIYNNANFYDYTNEAYVISCITSVADIEKLKTVLLAEIDKMHAGNYITQREYIKYQSQNSATTDTKTECTDLTIDLEIGISTIRSDFKIQNYKFSDDIYDHVSLDTLNKIVAFIFDPKVCELFIFTNPSLLQPSTTTLPA